MSASDESPPKKRGFRFRFWKKDKPEAPVRVDGPVSTTDILNQVLSVNNENVGIVLAMDRDLNAAEAEINDAADRLARCRETMERAQSQAVQAAPMEKKIHAETETLSRKVYRDKCCILLSSLVSLLIIAALIVQFAVTTSGPATVTPNATRTNTTNGSAAASALFDH